MVWAIDISTKAILLNQYNTSIHECFVHKGNVQSRRVWENIILILGDLL